MGIYFRIFELTDNANSDVKEKIPRNMYHQFSNGFLNIALQRSM